MTGLINLEALARDRDQLWAEAAQREATGESIVLPQELWGDAAEEQGKRLETDPWESALAPLSDGVLAYFNGNEERISTEVLLEKVLQIQTKDQHSGHYKRLATSMRRLGWDGPKNIREGGKVYKGYERKKVAPSEQTQLPFDFSKK